MKTNTIVISTCLTLLIAHPVALSNTIEAFKQPATHLARTGKVSSNRSAIASLPSALIAFSGAQRGSVAGQVLLPSGQQANTRIRVTLSGYRIPSTTVYTDNKGRFSIPGVSDGTYTLEILAESGPYETVYQEVRIIYGAHPMLVITLREKGNASKSNAGVVSASEVDQQVPEAARKEYEKGVKYS